MASTRKTSDDIASVAFWYQTEPHAAFPPLPALDVRTHDAKRPPVQFVGALECESLEIVDCTLGLAAEVQSLEQIGDGWSSAAQLFVRAKAVGDFVEVAVPAEGTEAKRIVLHATRATDYGILRFTVNGKILEPTFDGYAESPAPRVRSISVYTSPETGSSSSAPRSSVRTRPPQVRNISPDWMPSYSPHPSAASSPRTGVTEPGSSRGYGYFTKKYSTSAMTSTTTRPDYAVRACWPVAPRARTGSLGSKSNPQARTRVSAWSTGSRPRTRPCMSRRRRQYGS